MTLDADWSILRIGSLCEKDAALLSIHAVALNQGDWYG